MKVEKKLENTFLYFFPVLKIYANLKKIIFLVFFCDFFTKIYNTKNWEKNLKFCSLTFLGNTFLFNLKLEWRKSDKNFRRSSNFKWGLFAKIEIGENGKRVWSFPVNWTQPSKCPGTFITLLERFLQFCFHSLVENCLQINIRQKNEKPNFDRF